MRCDFMVASGMPEFAVKVESSGGRMMAGCNIGSRRRYTDLMHI